MCTQPLKAFVNPDGGRPIFGYEGFKKGFVACELPCGKCPECYKDYYQGWAIRGSRELLRWESNVFLTLTYNGEHCPKNYSLVKSDVQAFIKRLKKHYGSCESNPIRQIYCGEYGETNNRPHYHCVLFNTDFADRKRHRTSDQGHPIFTSATLDWLWGKGFCEFGYAGPGSIAYIFKYILKKKTRKEKKKGPRVIEVDGVTYEVEHEFIEASRNPGIGAHMRGHHSIHKGYLTDDGTRIRIPKYYLNWLKENDPSVYDELANKKFDFMVQKPVETELRRKQKTDALKRLTGTKRKM